ncbi:MAG: hypothetical protein UT00_C0012G0010 [Parcubacteria group bacterium GW2011_GWA1_38_7]|nr:MAG: hypothetical protein UT00_C0012G0010 [Parcubacteria group bacterium GW2011_GWA1_38_7]
MNPLCNFHPNKECPGSCFFHATNVLAEEGTAMEFEISVEVLHKRLKLQAPAEGQLDGNYSSMNYPIKHHLCAQKPIL